MVNIALIGAGAISGIYLKNIRELFLNVRVMGVCDAVRERAEKVAAEYGIARVYDTLEQALSDVDVQLVLNLTRPVDHFAVSRAALLAGKHVYSEKPLATNLEEGHELAELARHLNLLLGGAPDTFMGAGLQTCRKLIDDGWIGQPIGAACFMLCHGHEAWHSTPDFYFQRGGGPMMDMGPYYITALVSLFGGIDGVTAACAKSFSQRLITSPSRFGQSIPVEVDTHVSGTLHFESGAMATVLMSFDVHCAPQNQSRFEVYGSKGTLLVPDPNTFGGAVRLYRPEDQPRCQAVDPGTLDAARQWIGFRNVPLLFDYAENSRGLGLADLCEAVETGRVPRADAALVEHVLEVLTAFQRSSDAKAYWPIRSKCMRPAPMKAFAMRGVPDLTGA